MKLKKGITGIWNVKDELVASTVDLALFRSLLYTTEYNGLFKVMGFKDVQVNNNYYTFSVRDLSRNHTFDLLLNSIYPYYCGVEHEPDGWMSEQYINVPDYTRNTLTGFDYLSPAELKRNVEAQDLEELMHSEQEEIKKWRSKTFGEIIFNGYD